MSKNKKQVKFNDKIEGYFRWPIFYLLIIAVITVIGALYHPTLGFVFSMFLALSTALAVYLMFFNRKNLMSNIVRYAMNLDERQKELITQFELPYIILDSMGRIKWTNDAFQKLFPSQKTNNMKISCMLSPTQLPAFPMEEDGVEKLFDIENKIYNVVFKKVSIEKSGKKEKRSLEPEVLHTVYFFDVSRKYELELLIEQQKAVFCLIYIDSYDEVINSLEEVRRPLLIALIDRNINKFANEVLGVVRKFEKDKYLIVFPNKYLQEVREDKFSILDTVRETNIGNDIPVTLSIGVGTGEESFVKNMELSKNSLDLALGRGGDQAVVKKGEKLYFYGGNTRGVEKTTRVKARMKAHAFKELINDCERVLIMGHKLGDMDSLGASMGVYACAKHLGKPAHIIINKITTSINPVYEAVIEDKEYPSDLFINNQQAISFIGDRTLLVVVDVNRPSYTEYPELLKYIKKIVVFDHHRVMAESVENAVLSYIEPYASSTCEMITEIIRYLSDNIKLRTVEADALFAGISVDTKNFIAKTGVKTFEAAAFLRRSGADSIRVSKFFKNDLASYKAKATAVKDAQIYRDIIAISECPSDIVNPSMVAAQSADDLLNITGIKASFVLTQIENTVYISSRSIDDINVQIIMEKLGGGGHLSVAGAQLENYTIPDAMKLLKDNIDEYCNEKGEKA